VLPVVALAVVGVSVLALVATVIVLYLALLFARQRQERHAREFFQDKRQLLQQEFFQAAATSGKPKGLRWRQCDWEEWVVFARQRQTGELVALASLTVHFEAIEGGDMEGVAAVSLPRNATAVFFFHSGAWHTTGKVVFNLNPDETIQHFRGQYETL
jgi:hypothetical protein